MLTTTTARKEAKMMDENKNLEEKDEVKVAGGATINGAQKTLIEESEIKKYEYNCKNCGRVSYRNSNCLNSCPYCGRYFGYSPTGVVLIDYNYVNGANWRSIQSRDT